MDGCPFFTRLYRLYNSHVEEIHLCQNCNTFCADRMNHQCQQGGQVGGAPAEHPIDTSTFKEHQRAHRGSLRSYIHELQETDNDLTMVLNSLQPAMVRLLTELLHNYGNLKVIIKVSCIMAKQVFDSQGEEDMIEQIAYFANSIPKSLFNSSEISDILLSIADEIGEKIADFISKGSGYAVRQIRSLEVKVMDFQLFRDLRGNGPRKMPFRRQGCVSFNTDNCFKYCIAAGLNWDQMQPHLTPKQLRHHVTWEQFFHLYDFSDAVSDVSPYEDVPKFEKRNEISCNIYGNMGDRVILIRESLYKFPKYVNLFLIRGDNIEGVPDPGQTHYVLIRDLSKFLCGGRHVKRYACPYCKEFLSNEKKLILRMAKCQGETDPDDVTEEIMPDESDRLTFKRYEMLLPFPAVLYYDFETASIDCTDQRRHLGSSTTMLNEFVPCSFSLVVVWRGRSRSRVIAAEYYDGPDVMLVFFRKVFRWAHSIVNHLRRSNNTVLPTPQQREQHARATHCEYCKREFSNPRNVFANGWDKREARSRRKSFHHDHSRGVFIASICSACNLRIK